MKLYLSEECIVVNNKFENKCFIYDRMNRVQYDINIDAFNIIKYIKTKSDISNKYYERNKVFIEQLLDLNILKYQKQKSTYNVKELTEYNNARIFAELTNKCNLRCEHCYGSFDIKNNLYLDFVSLKRLIRNARKNGVYQFDLTGGEPFLYPYFEELLEYLYKSGMLVKIFSNLTLLDNKKVDTLIKYGVKDIVTSVDSAIKEDHDTFRGKNGSFEKTIESIKLLKEKKISVSVNTMIGKHNENRIKELVDLIKSLKVNSVLDVIIPSGRAISLKENITSSARIIKSIYNEYYKIVDYSAIAVNCGIGDRFVYLKSNGNIYLCPSLTSDEYKISDIKSYDTKTVWKTINKKFSYIKCNKKTKKCKNCNGGCRARALLLHKDLCSEDDVYCIISGVKE